MTEEYLVRNNGIWSSRVSSGGNSGGKLERIISGKKLESEPSWRWFTVLRIVFQQSDTDSVVSMLDQASCYLVVPASCITIGTYAVLPDDSQPSKGDWYWAAVEVM
jgi:hypothetical protein